MSTESPIFNPYALKHWPTHFGFAIARLIALLPYPVLYRIGEWLGVLMYKLAKQRTRIARINIQKCFPDLDSNQQELLVKENMLSTGIGMLETAMLWFGPPRKWDEMVEIEGLEHLEEAKNQGKGGLLLAFHLTTLEIGGSLLGLQFPIAALYRKNEKPLIEKAMTKGRSRFVHPIPREATRDMMKWIKNNGFVWYAADQDYGRRQSIFVPFFNIPTATITATTRFAKLTKAPVIPMTQERIGRGKKIKVTIHSPLDNIGQDEIKDASAINDFLEKYLDNHKADYLWVHRRFKTRPNEDDASFYPKKINLRPITPDRYKVVMESAIEQIDKNGLPYRLVNNHQIIYFIYRKKGVFKYFNKELKNFIEQHYSETHNNEVYQYQGMARYCEHKNCDLVYLEKVIECE